MAMTLPEGYTAENHIERLQHCDNEGYIMLMLKEGEIVAFAELYQLDAVPNYPVYPYPKSVESGRYLYCYSCCIKDGYKSMKTVNALKDMAKRVFNKCDYLVYHRPKHNFRLKIERF